MCEWNSWNCIKAKGQVSKVVGNNAVKGEVGLLNMNVVYLEEVLKFYMLVYD